MGRLVVIQGATAAGKSAVAASLALGYQCPVVSCDSRQFYREMTIGTAVPSPEELAAATHY
ncbi:MAG: isopentenyl transferase family protein, partial [Mucinivorans sp.]